MKKILFMLLVVGLLLAMTGATYTSHPAPKNFVASSSQARVRFLPVIQAACGFAVIPCE